MKNEPIDLQLSVHYLRLTSAFNANPFPSYDARIEKLKLLKHTILRNQDCLLKALSQDFGYRSDYESIVGDIYTTVSAINYTLKHLKSWMKPNRLKIGIQHQPAHSSVVYQPLGVVGIIAPWNYPINLALTPLTAAIAAGNRVMLKASEHTPKTNQQLKHILSEVFEADQVTFIQGGAETAIEFTKLKFDHIFFTGSTTVGREVMRAAADNLVPCTLELGGKSPVIIDQNVDIPKAVTRFIFGKTFNAGQTCVAPDYVFCPTSKIKQLVEAVSNQYKEMYTEESETIDSTHVINQNQFDRLSELVEDAVAKGAKAHTISPLSTRDQDTFFPLTLITDCQPDMRVMQEEIFGPILPIVGYEQKEEVAQSICAGDRPLALYLIGDDKDFQDYILTHTHSGGVCINDAAFHVTVEELPFGGVGQSGFGKYHGREGFLTFSNAKAILKRGGHLYPMSFLFPPYGNKMHALFYKLFVR
ncbi:coniferyl aldehyde dehydrogenase [Vibrio penaeicida]|uniref:Aldehyde dehydrogenase n=1 Tax=Vibrio penaeicida TaxID=104609 RepID=A0AAV5NZ31_9VIBR|nr:coniferyl aldehyde dehydrogenase [Vibrio penaeicida]RTZ23713.1 coniferyl aldehyde dehydrogenase [Vibrio penaeicida]GLQ75808.1 aldehyde dehydrogenase [Vibrio penaeicida]